MNTGPENVVRFTDDPLIDWTRDPEFQFESEVDALVMLQELGEELRVAREQEAHVMRYLKAAVRTAAEVVDNGQRVSRQAIIAESGLSRRTVYDWLGEDETEVANEQAARAAAVRRRIAANGGTGNVNAALQAAIQRRVSAAERGVPAYRPRNFGR